MKRFSYCLIALLLLFTFASACGKSSGEEGKASAEAGKASEETAKTTEAETAETADDGPRAVMPVLSIPSRNVPDTESLRFVRSLGVGFNAGNTFDAYVDDKKLGDDTVTETAWVPDKLTKETIQAYHKAGFDSIRIPVSWHNHVSEDYTISEKWMARVKEAVDWALDDGMKVIINIHHDNHPEANAYYPDSAHLEQSKTYVRRIWEQVAETFSGYDERLIFEGLNEPRLVGTEYEWYVAQGVDVAEDSLNCINELNQVFVDTVRAAGKMNAARYLMVPGYAGSPDGLLSKSFKIPDDPTDPTGESHRIILEVHAYTPYDFALKPDGGWYFDSSKSACTKDIDWFMDRLYNTYVVKGVPVVIDEFGAVSRLNKDGELNIQDRVEYSAYYVAAARSRGMSCFVWDNSAVEGDGELFGLYNRRWQYFVFPEIVDALVTYGK